MLPAVSCTHQGAACCQLHAAALDKLSSGMCCVSEAWADEPDMNTARLLPAGLSYTNSDCNKQLLLGHILLPKTSAPGYLLLPLLQGQPSRPWQAPLIEQHSSACSCAVVCPCIICCSQLQPLNYTVQFPAAQPTTCAFSCCLCMYNVILRIQPHLPLSTCCYPTTHQGSQQH
jgi:hypothetical protein